MKDDPAEDFDDDGLSDHLDLETQNLASKNRLMSAVQQNKPSVGGVAQSQQLGSSSNNSKAKLNNDLSALDDIKSKKTSFPGFETDEQFQKYLQSLGEYDRSRYQQLLVKNKQLKDELRKIVKQTEDLIVKEK